MGWKGEGGDSAGGSRNVPSRAEESIARTELPTAVLALVVLGGVSFVAGEQRPWPLPPRAGLILRVSGLVFMAAALVTLLAWGVLAACAHVSAELSRWLEEARPAIVEMSVFAAAYLLAASQRRRRCPPSDDDDRGLRDPAAMSPSPRSDGGGDVFSGDGSGEGGRRRPGARAWGAAVGVLFASGARGGGGRRVGPSVDVEIPASIPGDGEEDGTGRVASPEAIPF